MNHKSLNRFDLDESDNLLRQVLGDIREEVIPEFPDPPLAVLESKTAPLASDVSSAVTNTQRPSMFFERRNQYVFITGAAVAAFLMTFLVWPQSGQTAFARMQAALQEVHSISYSVFDYHANGNTWETKVKMIDTGLTRSEQIKIGEGTVANGLQLSDWSQNLTLHIDPKSRKATFYETSPSEEMAARRGLLIEKLRNIREHATKDLGLETFEGRPANCFKLVLGLGGREFKVFVDVETNLPVHMLYEQTETGFRETFTNFEFDKAMDLKQFALEAPEGFMVERIELARPPENAELLVVSPKTGIGPVPFGSDADSVIDFLGEPSQDRTYGPTSLPGSDQPGQGFEYLKYNSLGLEIGVNSEYGMTTIRCQSQKENGPTIHDFEGQTAEGIRIGSSLPEVIAAYGKPDIVHKNSVDYIRLGWIFHVHDNEILGFEVYEPRPDEIELIFHDDGSFTEQVKRRQ